MGELCKAEYGLRDKCKHTCGLCTKEKIDMGVEQQVGGSPEEIEGVKKVLVEMERYYREEVLEDPEYADMYKECINSHQLCAFWAHLDECLHNPDYMTEN